MAVATVTSGNATQNQNQSQNQRKAFKTPTQAELMTYVNSEPNVAMSFIGPSYGTKTTDIEDGIFSELVDGYHLSQCVAVVINPVIRTRQEDGIPVLALRGERRTTAWAMFKLPDGSNKSEKNHVWRVGSRGNNGNDRLAINITARTGANGQFGCSQEFKQALINLAADSAIMNYQNDNNYDLIIRPHPDNRDIVMVELDVMRMIQFAINIPDPNINFSVTSADYIENGDAAYLTIQKYIDVIGGSGRRNNVDIQALRAALKTTGKGGYNGGNRRKY